MIGLAGVRWLVFALASQLCALPAAAEQKRALVIGIDAYRNVPKLERAVADARAVAGTFGKLGYDVRYVENPDRAAMSFAFAGFEESIEKGDTAFVFFAGHGIEVAGQNLLLPADVPDAGRASEGVLRDAGFITANLIERITNRGARAALFVFDACRNNPYAQPGATRSIGAARGLARVEPPEGVFVLMSAGQNQQALDSLNLPGRPASDQDPNSVFTRVLLQEVQKPGMSHIVLAKSIQARVRALARTVDHMQVPAFYDQISGDVTFAPVAAAAPTTAAPAGPAAPPPAVAALVPPGPPSRQPPPVDPLVDACDRAAGDSADPDFPPGLPALDYDAISAPSAVSICLKATAVPGAPRRVYAYLARAYGKLGSTDNATKATLKAAELGSPLALLHAGRMHVTAQGVPRDYSMARAFLERAVDAGVQGAFVEIGDLYHYGRGTPRDYRKAKFYYEKGIEAGSRGAYNELGILYWHGRGVAKNVAEACRLFNEAAKRGSEDGAKNISRSCRTRR